MRSFSAKLVVAVALVAGVGTAVAAPAVAAPRTPAEHSVGQQSPNPVRPLDWNWFK